MAINNFFAGLKRATRRGVYAVLVTLLPMAPAYAQMNSGEVAGSVQDQLGKPLPGAAILAQQAATGQKFSTTSNESGTYLFPLLPVGVYSVTATAANFKQAVLPNFEVHVGEKLRYDFTLEVGGSTEVVTVDADAGGTQLETAQISDIVKRQELNALPLKGRQFLDLAMLSNGVVRPPGGTRGDAMQQAGALVNVLGQRSGHNLYLLDGVSVTDEHFNNMVVSPSVDAIDEVNLQKTSYAPEFGGKSGAVINVVSRAGSNQLHGSLREFARNNIFDAKNFFDAPGAPTPPFHQNQFGASVGGPVRKNRTFFFTDYEGQRVRKSLTQTFSVPADAMRTGDLTGLAAIYDPSSTTASGTRTAFPGNRIPLPLLDPVAMALLAQVPLPNLAGTAQNLRSTETQSIDTNTYSARVDHRITDNDNTYFRASLFDARQADPFGSGVLQESLLPGFARTLSTHSINGVAGWTHGFTANLLNEARFGVLTVIGGQRSPNAGNPFASQTGIQGVTANPADLGYPQFSFGGQFTTMGDPALFTYRNNRDFEFSDNVTFHHGTHELKFGAYFMHYELETQNPNGARGIFSYTPRFTSSAAGLANGNAFADFLLGDPSTAQVGLGRAAIDGSTNWAQFYAQDSWQAARNLKIEIGLRYEYNQNMTDSENRLAAIDTSVAGGRFVVASDGSGNVSPLAAPLLPLAPLPVVTSAQAGWNNSLLTTRPIRLAPRAGFAWSPGNSKNVIRGGVGIYPNQAAYSIITNFAQNLPFFVTKTVSGAAAALSPTFTTENALTASSLGTFGGNDLNHDFKIEYNEVWNLSAERELTPGTVLTAAYIGSRTVHADSSTVLNVPVPGSGAIAARRPIPQLSQFNTIRWDGWATYHAFTLSVKRRFARGLTYDVNWTWSHSIDDASDPGTTLNEANLPQDVRNMAAEKASSSFDHRHRVVVSFVYQIPAPRGRGLLRAAFGQWQAGGNFTAQTGAPFTVNLSSDQANIGAGPAQRPNLVGDPAAGGGSPDAWLNPAAFALPALYTFGNAPRNAVIGPPLSEVDLSLQKDVAVRESVKLQLRAEAYNFLNHPNFNIPNRMAFTPNFGKISSAQDSRQMQFAVKLIF
ncbi:MAG TPA: carboxypeptidase-like regulatory domain-containing protein [Bryobacteraceae bacterium]